MRIKLVLLAFCLVTFAFGQAPTNTQQSATTLDSATQCTTSASSAATLTLTPQAGQFVYLDQLDIANCAGSSAVTAATVTTITTTNITGSPIWTIGSGVAAGLCTQTFSVSYPKSLKSAAAGTATTFVLPTFATNQTIRLNVCWRSAP